MLLRTSSAPVLSALNNLHFSPGEVSCRDPGEPTQCNHNSSCLSASHSLASPFLLPSRSSSDVLPFTDESHPIVAPVSDLNSEWISRPQLRLSGVQSEGDLARFSASTPQDTETLPETESVRSRCGRVPRVSLQSGLSSCNLKECIEEETDCLDQSPAPQTYSTDNSFPLHNCIVEETKGQFSNLIPPQKLQLNDGELHTSAQLCSSGSPPLVCGCRPLTQAESKTLGFLDMASGVGFSNGSGHLGGHLMDPDFSDHKEAYYQELIQADPENPLLLRNYAELLAKKGQLAKSEEYYERAILADPSDGEVLSQYAKLQWDVNRDEERAESYYGQALKAAPDDCYVMASYASFLWDVEDNEECLATPIVPNSGVTSSNIFTPACAY